jgi:hypothetical protein
MPCPMLLPFSSSHHSHSAHVPVASLQPKCFLHVAARIGTDHPMRQLSPPLQVMNSIILSGM